ncbi:MAG: hypothetical protein ACFFDO_00135 [Candidatus Thorarchaeota archaeon]
MNDSEFNKEIEKLGRKKLNLLSSEALENSIKNLTNPRFLGSIHMKNLRPNTNFSSIENLLKGELELKINKSLKNTIFNPIAKILIILMITFNIIWITIFFLL